MNNTSGEIFTYYPKMHSTELGFHSMAISYVHDEFIYKICTCNTNNALVASLDIRLFTALAFSALPTKSRPV